MYITHYDKSHTARTDARGEDVEKFLIKNNFLLLNDGAYTNF